ncbi:hypothetical protein O6H91_06G069600 [Diphasiastrum complanatum]|nr:hypothetical protein O6H91_06G069600 [Diphasiastrum complanatum]
MQKESLQPDTYTFVLVLKACSSLKALDEGREVHAKVIQCDSESNIFVGSSLIDMYARCGRMEDAFRVFKNMPTHDVVVWNSMIAGYVKTGQGYKALKFFQEMQKVKLEPDALTFVALLNACASMATLEEGRHLHLQVVQKGLEANLFIGSALVDMYVKCGIIEDAYRVFCNLQVHDVVSWSSMITGYVRYGQGEKALELFHQMQKEQVKPDSITFVSVLNACASTVALETGRHIHAQVLRKGLESDIFVGSSLIDMYAKCGSIEDACKVFNNMPFRNAVSWNAMILGFGMHGLGKNTCQMFEQMCQECAELNDATFVCLLAAFSFTGLVDNGCCCFESMTPIYGISMKAEHYSCMVDLLGRSGCLDEATSLIRTMWCPPHACVWRALLCSCRIHGNVKMGELAAKHLLELDPENASGYVLMSNIYAVAGNWESAHNVQQLRSKRHVYKQQGCSCLR